MEIGKIDLDWIRREICTLKNTGASSQHADRIIFAKIDVYNKVLKKALETNVIESKAPEMLEMLTILIQEFAGYKKAHGTSKRESLSRAEALIKSVTEIENKL